MRVVFMGTPDIAATCLQKILDDGFQVVGVYTQPDRPKNRGMKLAISPVKDVAHLRADGGEPLALDFCLLRSISL